jgi:ectoine hydroxylase-related dioxygenase (phytanoyl-CoA dioxygenase family)
MDPKPLTPEEDYGFDVGGFIVVPQVLKASEIEACNEALDTDGLQDPDRLPSALVRLVAHPVLARYLDQLTYDGYYLDGPPRLVDAESSNGRLIGGNEPREATRAYYHQNDVRFAQGVIAIWALTDVDEEDGGFVLVPASHKSGVESPESLIDGSDDLDLTRQIPLRAGDLLLCVEGILHGARPWATESRRQLALTFASDQSQRSGKKRDPAPAWVEELTPEQQAVVAPGGRPDEAPVLLSDGDTISIRTEHGVHHPSTLVRNTNSSIDETEFYLWDLCGHLVIRNVMDAEWLSEANAAIEACADRIEVGGDAAKGSSVLAGTGVPSLKNLFELPEPHCQPFRRMLANPAVIHRLNWMMGSGFIFRGGRAICSVKGTSGHGLHSGNAQVRPAGSYVLQNGRTYCETINVAWQLRDVTEADGGFVCIPGSHKARYPITPAMIVCEETLNLVRHVEMKAGDVALFLAAAQTHGAYPWKSDIDRRAVLLNYSSRNLA